MTERSFLPAGATIGILGGGQLGRMLALAAATLGYRCHIFCPEQDSPAAQVADQSTVASYDDPAALAAFGDSVDLVTIEFENLPIDALKMLAETRPVRPNAKVLEMTQDRLLEKQAIVAGGASVAPFRAIGSAEDLRDALGKSTGRSVLKSRRLGYDGKGQAIVDGTSDADHIMQQLGNVPCILEAFVAFDLEISVIVARGVDGSMQSYIPVENRHRNHILDVTLAPADIPDRLAAEATQAAQNLAREFDVTGTLAVEMFVTRDGAILINEVAPRVHNSGHWSIEGCAVSQFEQHIRAVAGLPLGTADRHSNACMQNLIGAQVENWVGLLASDAANNVHLYGKAAAREGRKMGHVTRLFPLSEKPRPFL